MTTSRRLLLLLVGAAAACALSAPPEPEPIVCEEIDRAEERFPEECGDAGVDEDAGADAASDDESVR